MIFDEDGKKPKDDLFKRPTDDELNRLSVDELEARITWLGEEIERTKVILDGKQGALSQAEAIFKN